MTLWILALLFSTPTNRHWSLPPLPLGEETRLEWLSEPSLEPTAFQRCFRYRALADVQLVVEVWTEGDNGIFLELRHPSGEQLASDEEGFGGPSCILEADLAAGTSVTVCVGLVDKEDPAPLILVADQSPENPLQPTGGGRPPTAEQKLQARALVAQVSELERYEREQDWQNLSRTLVQIAEAVAGLDESAQLPEVIPALLLASQIAKDADRPELALTFANAGIHRAERSLSPEDRVRLSLVSARYHAQHQLLRMEEAFATAQDSLSMYECYRPDLATPQEVARVNVGGGLSDRGLFAEARRLFAQADQTFRHELPENSPQRRSLLGVRATCHQREGDLVGAGELLRREFDLVETALPLGHPLRVTILNALANVRYQVGDLPEARRLLEQSLRECEVRISKDSLLFHDARRTLASVLLHLGEWDAAVQLAEQVWAALPGMNRMDLFRTYGVSVAGMHLRVGQDQRAAEVLKEVEESGGFDHWERDWDAMVVAVTLDWRAGNLLSARARLQRYLEAKEREIAGASARERRQWFQLRVFESELAFAAEDQEAAHQAADRAFLELIRFWEEFPGDSHEADREVFSWRPELETLLRILHDDPTKQLAAISFLDSVGTSWFSCDLTDVTNLDRITRQLEEDELALRYLRLALDHEPHYLVFVVSSHGVLCRLDLGAADKVDALIARWRESLVSRSSTDTTELRKQLHRRLIQPWAEALRNSSLSLGRAKNSGPHPPAASASQDQPTTPGAEGQAPGFQDFPRLVVVPDYHLGAIPIEQLLAIEHEGPSDLEYRISLGSLAAPPTPPRAPHFLGVGGVDYAAENPATGLEDVPARARSIPRSSLRALPPLPATAREMADAARSFADGHPGRPVAQLGGKEATSRAFVDRARHASVIHLASHAWFLSEDAVTSLEPELLVSDETFLQSAYARVRGLSPGRLCGVAFAGAAAQSDNLLAARPGVLSAEQIETELDLRGTDLVVLSACETNIGVVRAGQGVVTLNRAFRLSGAKTVISSLWPVDDRATAEFFRVFYDQLFRKSASKSQALHAARESVRHHPDHPEWEAAHYWAAWVLYGDG